MFNVLFMALGFVTFSGVLANQNTFFAVQEVFHRQDVRLDGHVRAVAVKSFPGVEGKVVVALVRTGQYPKVQLGIQIWTFAQKPTPIKKLEVDLPSDVLLLDVWEHATHGALLLVRPKTFERWVLNAGQNGFDKQSFPLTQPLHEGEVGEAGFYVSALTSNPQAWVIPHERGVSVYHMDKHSGPKLLHDLDIPLRAFYRSSLGQLPFEFPFWVRHVLWFPQVYVGVLTRGGSEVYVSPWMDELDVFSHQGGAIKRQRLYLQRMTQSERDDGLAYGVATPADFNGDGLTDVLFNKFKGSATQMSAQTTLHLADGQGGFDLKGQELKAHGNRAAGAFPMDVNRDGIVDIVSASSQFNAWAVIQALTRKQVDVSFHIRLGSKSGIDLSRPSFSREMSFGFDLSDLSLKGFLPTLDGDFNGDGLPDAFYARNDREVTVLLQRPNTQEIFAMIPSATYDVEVRRYHIVADLNADGRADVILYDRRSQKNQSFTVLMNTGRLK